MSTDAVTALLARFPATARQPRDGAFGDLAALPPVARTLFDAMGGTTVSDGFYRFHTPASSLAASAACEAFVPEDSHYWCFAFDWNGREACVDVHSSEVVVVDPAVGSWFTTDTVLAGWHDELASEPGLLALPLFQAWRAAHREVGPLRFDQTIGYERPLFLGGVEDIDHLELWDRDVYRTLLAQLFIRTEGLPVGTPVDAAILDQVRRDLGLD